MSADWNSDEARAELIAKLGAASVGAVCDVYGYEARKLPDGRWHVPPDDEVVPKPGVYTAGQLLSLVCCYHSAHWPVEVS